MLAPARAERVKYGATTLARCGWPAGRVRLGLLQVRLPGVRSGEVGTGPPSPVAYFGEFTTDNGYFGPMGDRVSHPTACDSIFGVASNFYDLRYFLNNVRIELDNPFIGMMTMRFCPTRYKLQINGTTVRRKSNLYCRHFYYQF